MKINKNIPIFAVLTIFIASNTLLYRYLNDGYFIDKKPSTEENDVENIIFSLISDNERILHERTQAILLEAKLLREQQATVTDSEELKAISAKLKALEDEAKSVEDRVKNSENERLIAERKSQNDVMKLTELLESNSRLGNQLDSVTNEFENYVSTLENTLQENSYSENEINGIITAFKQNKGLNYLNNLVGNIQSDKTKIIAKFNEQLKNRSTEYDKGLQNISKSIGYNKYKSVFDEDSGLINTESSVNRIQNGLKSYITSTKNSFINQKANELAKQKKIYQDMLKSKEEKLAESKLETAQAIEDKKLSLEELENRLTSENSQTLDELKAKLMAENQLTLDQLEARLQSELNKEEIVKENIVTKIVPTVDKLLETNWIHIPGMWDSSNTELSYKGKRVDSIAWSRDEIEDNTNILFDAQIKNGGNFNIILYGNGRFKSWVDGSIISISDLGGNELNLSIKNGGIDDNARSLLNEKVAVNNGISGEYQIQVINGKLSINLDGTSLLKGLKLNSNLSGRVGFGNIEKATSPYSISHIKIFSIK